MAIGLTARLTIEKCEIRARLDALYFHLYRLSPAAAAYNLDTFPIVRRHDQGRLPPLRRQRHGPRLRQRPRRRRHHHRRGCLTGRRSHPTTLRPSSNSIDLQDSLALYCK